MDTLYSPYRLNEDLHLIGQILPLKRNLIGSPMHTFKETGENVHGGIHEFKTTLLYEDFVDFGKFKHSPHEDAK